MNVYERETGVLGRYLLNGRSPNAQCLRLYTKAMELNKASLSDRDQKILRFILKHKRSAGMIDSALALSGEKSGVRKKILILSAILETQPEYAELFLPQERSWFYNLYIFWVGARAILKAIAGKIVLAFI